MKTLEQIRIEAKLKLWDTPGFFQFIGDLEKLIESQNTKNLSYNLRVLKMIYMKEIWELEESQQKFKQGKLPL